MGIRRWTNKLRRFRGLSRADKWLFLRAIYWLAVARIWLARMPFADLAERLGADAGNEEASPELLRSVGYAVSAAGGTVPWRSDCFAQAIAAYKLLRKLGYTSTIHLGVNKVNKGRLLAHAWLTCGDAFITGSSAVVPSARFPR